MYIYLIFQEMQVCFLVSAAVVYVDVRTVNIFCLVVLTFSLDHKSETCAHLDESGGGSSRALDR